jgi:RNA polymerase sigma-70 factor (ECF subfamily)
VRGAGAVPGFATVTVLQSRSVHCCRQPIDETQMTNVTDPNWLADRFEAERPRLRAVAYRMLGSTAEAEDAVQDAWLRLSRSDAAAIDNLGAWLTTVVARLSLDRLRTRKAQAEESLDLIPLDVRPLDAEGGGDPEHEAILADSVGLAMLVVLETLTPAERLAFVLHDTFGLPFDEIAPIVEHSPTATRQLASRARRRVRGATASGATAFGAPSPARQRELVAAFLVAARAGDFEALLRVLDPDVVVRAEGPTVAALLGTDRTTRGREAVARQALLFRNIAGGARYALVNGAPGFVAFVGDRPFAVLGFRFTDGPGPYAIAAIDVVLAHDRLARLDLAAFRG